MAEALNQARIAFKKNEIPVGAVIVCQKSQEIICKAHNQNIELQDVTAHAEILAIRRAGIITKNYKLNNFDLYVTLEPCAMCAAAISMARINRIYYGASDIKSGGIESGAKFFTHSQCHHKPEIYSGINSVESETLLKEFFRKLRGC